MATIYVREQGTVVRKQGERLLITKEHTIVGDVPMHNLDQLVVMGNIQLTQPATAMLLRAGKGVTFATMRGTVLGSLLPPTSPHADLRVKQLQMMSDDAANLTLARQIVIGKLTNQRALLINARTTHAQIARGVTGIAEAMRGAQTVDNAESLRGYEGRAGAFYWPAFKVLLKNDYGFSAREYHPSRDPVNALLSFVYAFLQRDVNSLAQIVGLDPHLGFFHTIQYGRPSLVLDLMEEFRPLVCDPLVLNLLNLDIIQGRDFQRTNNPERPIALSEPAVKRVIEKYEERVTSPVKYSLTGETAAWRRVMELQTRLMARVIQGEASRYQAMTNAEG
ncbi:MAG: CRISPR-associated endonuclease Cas1 [Chloroflexi bacterium]|nr:CRISPR-associated endonuclease Cas1 [Chloroflexota bacterium]